MRGYTRLSLKNLRLLCLFITALSLWLLLLLNTGHTKHFILPSARTDKDNDDGNLHSGFVVNTIGCHIPDLDPFDPSIREFIYEEEDPKCEQAYGMPLVESNATALYIDESALAYYNITDITGLMCCYTPYWRVELQENTSGKYPKDVDFQLRFANSCTQFTDQVEVTDEFVKVQCFLNSSTSDKLIYTDIHAFTHKKTIVKRQAYDYLIENSISVIVLGVDSVSRLNLHRQMPLTVDFLKNNLSAVEFLGYNKVNDNTFPNLIPVLTGFTVPELSEYCWPREESVFDDCSFVWDRFRDAGHTTGFCEDSKTSGSIFTTSGDYFFRGLRKQPTDYYARPLYLQAEMDIGFDANIEANRCLGPRKSLQVEMNYGFKYAQTMKDVLSFIFLWGLSMTHDYINVAKHCDTIYKGFLEKLQSEEIFNRTVLVFMSDHGMRYGKMRETYQGYLKERLPFLFIAYPDWFRKRFPTAVRNLKTNTKKLTTPFDLHETLLDLVDLSRLKKKVMKVRSENLSKAYNVTRGISLFLPIPGTRVCNDAGITEHWCTCHDSVSVSTNDTMVKTAANYLVDHINFLIRDYAGCAVLKLNNITNAREEKSTSHKTFEASDGGLTDFSVTIETVPGKALFESTIRYNGNTKNFTIVGVVSRINIYGNQSSCISHFTLRMYCYCN